MIYFFYSHDYYGPSVDGLLRLYTHTHTPIFLMAGGVVCDADGSSCIWWCTGYLGAES